MPVKIRLARHGRKQHAYYHIVVANSRAPRDGRFIERIGSYNPNTNPATIDLDFDKALEWLNNGAQPTDTCRTILSHKGVMMKKHLLEGVKKGAFDLAEAENRFELWLKGKEDAVQAKKDALTAGFNEVMKKRLKAESKVNEARIAEISKKNAAAAAAAKPAQEPAAESAVTKVTISKVAAAKVAVPETEPVESTVTEASVAEIAEVAEAAEAEVEIAEVAEAAVEVAEVEVAEVTVNEVELPAAEAAKPSEEA
jgi:small subunit ribosomal protein S16